jgi:hypothetical protein
VPANAQYQGISLSYSQALAQGVQGETVAAAEGGTDAPWWLPVPAHAEVALAGCALPKTSQTPRVIVYPVSEFSAANEAAARQIAALRKLLQDKPASTETAMPFLPLFNAAQQLYFGAKYIAFQGGDVELCAQPCRP